MKMNPVVHFEMPAEDTDRMSEFYTTAFGWQVQKMGEEYGGYLVATTTESDANGPKEPGAINGGFYKKSKPEQGPSLVIAVDDITEHMKKVKAAGGEILGGASGESFDDIPGVGKYCSFKDTEGNLIGMLQPAPRAGSGSEA